MKINESIILRGGLTLGGIVLLALLSMVSSVLTAESSKGDAAAINLAGSLRMQSYRIATRLQNDGAVVDHAEAVTREIEQFERRLAQLWRTGAIPPTPGHAVQQQLKTIEAFWRDTLRPLLEVSATNAALASSYLRQVDDFVEQLDQFVKRLEQDTESKIRHLRLVQGAALLLTVLLLFVALYQLHFQMVRPLRGLMELARKARGGDLTVRTPHVGNDELGVLGHAFNLMAADLSALYADLEARVEQKTQALRLSNRSLELLYQTAKQLNESVLNDASYRTLLAEIEKLTGADSVALCLIDAPTERATQIFRTRPAPGGLPPFCVFPRCQGCLGDGVTHPLTADRERFAIPIKDQERQFGVLIVRGADWAATAAWQVPLLEAVARNIAAALRAGEQAEYQRRLALLDERTIIARELHDSLAQSLSYLKIQVSRLQNLGDGVGAVLERGSILAELRDALNSAYRQLRELIATFRLKMDHPRLEDSLVDTVQEFSRRGRLAIDLDHAGWTCALNPNEQIHVMQIVREALNNAVKHARASRVQVRLRGPRQGEAVIDICDDGVGLPDQIDQETHFGLNIMRERARHLGGLLSLKSRPGQGARVRLSFIPTAHRHPSPALGEARHA